MRLAILASGVGTTLQALLDARAQGFLQAEPMLVISNNADAGALRRAKQAGVATRHLSGRTHPDVDVLDAAMLAALREHAADLVLLSGYLRLIGPQVLTAYAKRIFNTHPALLPRHGGRGMYGDRVHAAVLASGDRQSGVSIHRVTAAYDEGPVVYQEAVPVLPGDCVSTLAARVQAAERVALVAFLNQLAADEGRRRAEGDIAT